MAFYKGMVLCLFTKEENGIMEKSIKSAVITGVCGIIAGMVGGAWITNTGVVNICAVFKPTKLSSFC